MSACCSTPCCSTPCPTGTVPTCGGTRGPADCLEKGDASCCPVEGAAGMWAQSFGVAMQQAQAEVLKAKILEAWGPMLDKAADGMIETMGALWRQKIAEVRVGEAKQAFRKNLRDLWLEDRG